MLGEKKQHHHKNCDIPNAAPRHPRELGGQAREMLENRFSPAETSGLTAGPLLFLEAS